MPGEIVEGLPDVFRRAFFAGKGHEMEPFVAGAIEDPFELAWRITHLRRIETDPDYFILVRQRLIQCLKRVVFR